MGIRDFFNRAIDWAAEQVQASTGEAERREKVRQLKRLAEDFKEKVTEAISKLNAAIQLFNQAISELNRIRSKKVKDNIGHLYAFLKKFGSCKPAGAYADEDEKLPAEFPQQKLDSIENYIAGVDWSQEDVFMDTFFLSPLGMTLKTRKQNLSMLEQIHALELQTEATLRELRGRENVTEQERKICSLYTDNIRFISTFITDHILPELELIEAFFQAEELKNEIICGNPLENLSFTFYIQALENTPYHRHYQFVKNAFAFYVLSCRIYNTPVLTNLLQNRTTENDISQLEDEKAALVYQSTAVSETAMVPRGGE